MLRAYIYWVGFALLVVGCDQYTGPANQKQPGQDSLPQTIILDTTVIPVGEYAYLSDDSVYSQLIIGQLEDLGLAKEKLTVVRKKLILENRDTLRFVHAHFKEWNKQVNYWIFPPHTFQKTQAAVWQPHLIKRLPFQTLYLPETGEASTENAVTFYFVKDTLQLQGQSAAHRLVLAYESEALVGIAISKRWQLTAASPFVDMLDIDPTIYLDLKYATTDNFLKEKLYHENRALLLPSTAMALKKAHDLLQKQGYAIKIWDAYRPIDVQWKMWNALPPGNRYGYVADPNFGSKHNRGVAVDVTLAKANGEAVEMPTGFDDFTPLAHSSRVEGLSEAAIDHRTMLKKAMWQAGFTGIRKEWWHFNGPERDSAKVNYNLPLW